jgi:hypothetical protein
MKYKDDLWRIIFLNSVYDDYAKSEYYHPYNSNFPKFLEECLGVSYDRVNLEKIEIVDEQKFMIAKIKYGI